MLHRLSPLAVVLALATSLAAGGDDVLCLEDGRIFDGLTLERTEQGVTIHFEHGDVLVPKALVHEALIAGGPDFVPRTDEEREMFEQGKVPFEGKWISVGRRDGLIRKRLAEQRAAIEEMRAHREWANRYQTDSKNFRFEYTVPQHIFEGFRDRMEAYFTAFSKDWKVKRGRGSPKLNVAFYGTRKEFHRTSGAGSYVLGYFKFVGDYDLNIYYDRLDPAETEDVMFHEANHYLQKLINEDFSYPHWPGEALAEYYGASEWDAERKKLRTGLLQEGRLTEVKTDIAGGKRLGLRELITTDGMYEHYTWGWTLVHFLMNDKRYAKKFQRFFVALANGKGVKRVEQGFGSLRTVDPEEVLNVFRQELRLKSDADLDQLETDWHAYVDELDPASSRGLELAANAARYTGRPIRAKRLFREAIEAGTTNALTHHKYAEVLLGDGDRAGAIQQWRKAIELDPLTGTFYHSLGEALSKDDAEEGKRLKALARELDPDAATDSWLSF